jgi:uncharacterized membrane protein
MEQSLYVLETDVPEVRKTQGQSLFSGSEGRLLLVGLGFTALFFIWLALGCPFMRGGPHEFAAITVAQVFLGRVAGMSVGYAMDIRPEVLVPFAMFIETAFVLLCYALFVLSWRRLLVIGILRRSMERTRKIAEDHHDAVVKYGIPGLLFFVWFPFWMTGPFIGSVIGFMLGLRSWVNLTVVLIGTYLAVLSWGILLRRIHEHVVQYSPYAPLVLVGLLIGILVAVFVARSAYRNARPSKK